MSDFVAFSACFSPKSTQKRSNECKNSHFSTVYYYKVKKQGCQTLFGVIGKNIFIMRIDKFLKVSRILKRRTLAQEACDKGKVTVNGAPAKSGRQIKAGDVVEINYVSGSLKFKINEIKETVKKDEASSLYEIIN